MLVDIRLEFLGPARQRVAMISKLSVAAELAHHERLLILRLPLESVSFLRQTIVPADILIAPKNVEKLTQRIVNHLCFRIAVMTFHRGREQARRIETPRVRDQVAQERKSSVAERRFI